MGWGIFIREDSGEYFLFVFGLVLLDCKFLRVLRGKKVFVVFRDEGRN